MIAFLETLARMPGVEYVLLISHDGVPIAHAAGNAESPRDESLAALAASWLNDVAMAVAPLTWNAPDRVCLRAARGTLVLRRSSSACLVVLLGRETAPEDVRLPMDGTLARIERARLGRTRAAETQSAREEPDTTSEPEGPIPSRLSSSAVEEDVHPARQPRTPPGN